MNTARVIEIIQEASQIALSRYGLESGKLKEDGSWVTETDTIIEDFFRERFTALLGQDTHIFGEERGWTGSESAPYNIIIDPIEGTGPFRDQIPVWGISVGIFYLNKPWVGVFSMPAANHLFVGEFGTGAELDGKPLKIPKPTIPTSKLNYLGLSSDAHHWDLRQYPGKVRAFGATGCHVAFVASGALQAALLTRFSFYDIAATAIILWAAGGRLFYLSGQQVAPEEIIKVQKPREAVLACHPDAFEEIRKYIHR